MFPCCGQREKRDSPKSSAATNSNARPTTTTNEPAPHTNPPQDDANTPQNEHFNSGADAATSEPEPEFDLNSSIFMPDPARKKKPSPFQLASASYAEATDFSAGKEHLPSLGEGEEYERAEANPRDGK